MLGYTPRSFPQLMVRTASPTTGLLGKLGNAPGFGDTGVLSMFSSVFSQGQSASNTFDSAALQLQAQQLNAERSSNWATFGAIAAGVAGLMGVVYFLRR